MTTVWWNTELGFPQVRTAKAGELLDTDARVESDFALVIGNEATRYVVEGTEEELRSILHGVARAIDAAFPAQGKPERDSPATPGITALSICVGAAAVIGGLVIAALVRPESPSAVWLASTLALAGLGGAAAAPLLLGLERRRAKRRALPEGPTSRESVAAAIHREAHAADSSASR